MKFTLDNDNATVLLEPKDMENRVNVPLARAVCGSRDVVDMGKGDWFYFNAVEDNGCAVRFDTKYNKADDEELLDTIERKKLVAQRFLSSEMTRLLHFLRDIKTLENAKLIRTEAE